MCDCVGLCICLITLSSAFISYHTCDECIHYTRLETMDKEDI